MNTRSPNLPPVALEDIFDKSPSHAVLEFSRDIEYAIQKQGDAGMSANVMFTVLHFHAANMMTDIQYQAKQRVTERELQEAKALAESQQSGVVV